MNLQPFATWRDVLAHAYTGAPLYYQAPLDPKPVCVRTVIAGILPWYSARARTIRITPYGAVGRGKARTADPFTADAEHLDRFSRPV